MGRATRQRPPWSMQTHLIAIALGITLLAWIGGMAVTANFAQRDKHMLHDRELKEVAVLLLGLSDHEIAEMGASPISSRILNGKADNEDTLGEDYRYQVWSSDGQLLLTNFGIPSASPMARLDVTGYSWLEMDGERWRVFSLHSAQMQHEIQVAERAALRQWSFDPLDASLFALALGSLAVVVIPAMWLLRRLLRPVRDLTRALVQRSPANLEGVRVESVPRELTPVVDALNDLFGRVAETISSERNFTALAAHELRTPLATLRVLAEAARSAESPAESQRMLDELIRSADRCSRLQDQLLTLSRLDAVKSSEMAEAVDMTEVVMEALSTVVQEARSKQTKLVSRVDGSSISAHRFGVLTLLRNLLSNAVRYSPNGGRIEIATSSERDTVTVTIDDAGPGVPAAERERVFERFTRLNVGQESGVGLGLSIVATVARAHGATVELLESPLGGLRVVVTFAARLLPGSPMETLDDAPAASPANDHLAPTG